MQARKSPRHSSLPLKYLDFFRNTGRSRALGLRHVLRPAPLPRKTRNARPGLLHGRGRYPAGAAVRGGRVYAAPRAAELRQPCRRPARSLQGRAGAMSWRRPRTSPRPPRSPKRPGRASGSRATNRSARPRLRLSRRSPPSRWCRTRWSPRRAKPRASGSVRTTILPAQTAGRTLRAKIPAGVRLLPRTFVRLARAVMARLLGVRRVRAARDAAAAQRAARREPLARRQFLALPLEHFQPH